MKSPSRAVRPPASLLPLTDLDNIVILCRKPYPAYERLDLLLACFGRTGRFEVLSAAWERVLGYGCAELDGRPLFELIHLPRRSARRLILMLLDESEPCPIAFSLSRKDGTQVPLQWYRRFDAYDARLFIAGDPLAGDPLVSGPTYPVICSAQGTRRGASSPRSLTAPDARVL
jgi:PAS domain S-box-containing protein